MSQSTDIINYNEEEGLSQVGSYLIHVRQIPNYYFRRKMRRLGLPPDTITGSYPNRWVTAHGRVRLEPGELYRKASRMFIEIHESTRHHPRHETHLQARRRLQDRLQDIENRGITLSAIADNLDMSAKVIQKMLTFTGQSDTYTTQCPWLTIDRVLAADWTSIDVEQPLFTEPVTPYSITEREIQQQRQRDVEAERLRALRERHYINPGDKCWNCGASWPSLIPEPTKQNQPPREMRCQLCSRVSTLKR